jgi:hypothetical protein
MGERRGDGMTAIKIAMKKTFVNPLLFFMTHNDLPTK